MPSHNELKELLSMPIEIASNTYLHFYNGGKLRAEFMGEANPRDDFRSEEWIFSTNRAITPGRDNPPTKGFSVMRLPSGETALLKELLEAFPHEALGKQHAARFGPTLGLLVKVFDVGDGAHIPVHWHPSPEFARQHLNSPYGKNEAWILIGTRPGAKAWIGWKRDVSVDEFRAWMDAQDVEAMRSQMHEVQPEVGDVVFIRAEIVHSLGSGVCVLEPQEPTDWNILAEWKGYPYGREDAHLGLGWDLALQAASFQAMPIDYLEGYVRRTPAPLREEAGGSEASLVPDDARPYFFVTRMVVHDRLDVPPSPSYTGLVTVGGRGKVVGAFGERRIGRGVSLFLPASLSTVTLVADEGSPLEVIRCFPPSTSS